MSHSAQADCFIGAGQNSLVRMRLFFPLHFAKMFLKRLRLQKRVWCVSALSCYSYSTVIVALQLQYKYFTVQLYSSTVMLYIYSTLVYSLYLQYLQLHWYTQSYSCIVVLQVTVQLSAHSRLGTVRYIHWLADKKQPNYCCSPAVEYFFTLFGYIFISIYIWLL